MKLTQRTFLIAAIIIGASALAYNFFVPEDDTLVYDITGAVDDVDANVGTFTDRLHSLFGSKVEETGTGKIIDDRFLVVGDFPEDQLKDVIKNLEAGEEPGTEYGAGANRAFDVAPSQLEQYNEPPELNVDDIFEQLDMSLAFSSDEGVLFAEDGEEESESNPDLPSKPSPTDDGWYVDCVGDERDEGVACTPQLCKNFGTPERPNPRCVNGAPASHDLGGDSRCYIKRDGSTHCARSPAYSISPIADPGAVSSEVLPVCGWNQKKGEQTGIGPPQDVALNEIGLCLDVTHAAWTPCGSNPGPPPTPDTTVEHQRGIDWVAPPPITYGGCSAPCGCALVPSGNCRQHIWCVGPPGCTCCPGLACNVCCAGSAWLWDATSGWCSCADDVPISPSEIAPPK